MVLVFFSGPLLAADGIPVVDRTDQAATVSQSAAPAPAATARLRSVAPIISSNQSSRPAAAGAMVELLLTLDQLQEEVASLRGQLEQQQNKLRRMATSQRDRYRDLDRRLGLLNEQSLARPAVINSQDASLAASSLDGSGVAASGAASAASASDGSRAAVVSADRAYKLAFGLVRERKFGDALQAFENFLRRYPDDPLTPNVLYWTGEVYRVQPNPDLTKASFAYQQVVENHPEHAKAGDAYYKLGLSYQQMGQAGKAKASMTRLIELFPDQPVAALAQDFLKQHR